MHPIGADFRDDAGADAAASRFEIDDDEARMSSGTRSDPLLASDHMPLWGSKLKLGSLPISCRISRGPSSASEPVPRNSRPTNSSGRAPAGRSAR